MAVSAAAHQLPVLSPLTASALAASQRPELLMPEASAALALLRLRPEASAALALLRLRPEASAALALLRLRLVASGALPLADLAISEASVDLAGLATLPLLAPLRLRRLASGLAQHLFLPLDSVLPTSLRLRS